MRALSIVFLAVLVVGLAAGTASAQLAKPVVAAHESGLYKVQLITDGKTLYNMRWEYNRVSEGGKTYLVYSLKGDNDTQGAERIDWDEETKLEETPQGFVAVHWKKSSRGAEQMDWLLEYDWAARKATYNFTDRATGKKEQKSFPLTADSMAGDAMYLLLRGFPFGQGAGCKIFGNVISGGDLLKGNIVLLGEEKLTTPLGTFDTYKLELKPKGLIGMLPTKFYMWFSKKAPHVCLRFDGLEGIQRTKTVAYELQPLP